MNNTIPEPKRGHDVIAWAMPVTARLNAFPEKPGSSFRNDRDRRCRCAPGCWIITAQTVESENDDDGTETAAETVHVFANQFVLRGEVLDELSIGTTIESVMPQGTYDPTDPEDGSFFVCVKVDARHPAEEQPSLVVAGDLEELAAMQQDQSFIVRPLYKLSLMLDILADLRSVPALQRVEVLS